MKKEVIIRSPTFGLMTFDGPLAELIQTPEFERLASIRQLGPIYLIYPGGGHSRKLHALEVAFVAMEFAKKLGLSQNEIYHLGAAGLLHDLGHGPYSHSTEILFHEIYGEDHMDYTAKLITGEAKFPASDAEKKHIKFGQIPKILQKYKVSPQVVAELICKKYVEKPYMQELIFGSIDADQLAFLLSDSRFSGVNFGDVSLDTLTHFAMIRTLEDGREHLIYSVKALTAIKDMLMARISMYNFYLVDTGLIITEMIITALRRALRIGEIRQFEVLTDDELRYRLINSSDPVVSEFGTRIKYRRLFKKAFVMFPFYSSKQKEILKFLKGRYYPEINDNLNEDNRNILQKLEKYSDAELRQIIKDLISEPDIPDEYILINRRGIKDVELTEPRLKDVRDVRLQLENGQIVKFIELEPFFTLFLENATPMPYVFFIAVPEEIREKVSAAWASFISKL